MDGEFVSVADYRPVVPPNRSEIRKFNSSGRRLESSPLNILVVPMIDS